MTLTELRKEIERLLNVLSKKTYSAEYKLQCSNKLKGITEAVETIDKATLGEFNFSEEDWKEYKKIKELLER